jgi:hypothetical protein
MERYGTANSPRATTPQGRYFSYTSQLANKHYVIFQGTTVTKIRSIGLWRWYIYMTITILGIIHYPVYYLNRTCRVKYFKQRNVNKMVCLYLTGNTLRLRYEPNRLMLSIGLWQWYTNTTITVLHIIHRPVYYLKLNPTLSICLYLTRNTLRLRYEPNRLMLSIGLWRWYINTTITILDIIHRHAGLCSSLCAVTYFITLKPQSAELS